MQDPADQPASIQEDVIKTRQIISLLDDWGVSDKDQIALLGLPENTRSRMIRRYRKDTPLPADKQVIEHIEHLQGIAEALRTSFPRNAAAGAMWMKRPNHRFDDRAPIQAMLEDGINGVMAVRVHLDCSYDWHLDNK
ncbi:MAG: hypothetical protein BMS9Abin26_1679 [Gammaproteobacteria bacterium]|nr:MAG: hypothetical protein BMS9Abin26_1679 [Gammaproteobacteria bacterium]